jgi:hypothetical protein
MYGKTEVKYIERILGKRVKLKDEIDNFAKELERLGISYKYSDYGLSLTALIKEDEGLWIAQQFRPERDGYKGFRIISKESFKEVFEDEIKKYRNKP